METSGSGWSWVEVDVQFSNTGFVVHLGTAVYNKHPVKLDDSAPVSLTIVNDMLLHSFCYRAVMRNC